MLVEFNNMLKLQNGQMDVQNQAIMAKNEEKQRKVAQL